MQKSLNGEWQFRELQSGEWQKAEVPGCNYLDLMATGKIKDPFDSTNEKDVYWVAKKDWEYTKTFVLTEKELEGNKIFLCADCLDTIASVYINEKLVAKTDNCHIGYRFSVDEFLRVGENTIRIEFYSPVNYVTEKQKTEKCPRNSNGQTGIPHIRKPQCHFGWDWGPVLPPSGISDDIYLDFVSAGRIADVNITQIFNGRQADLHIAVENEFTEDKAVKTEIALYSPAGEKLFSAFGDTADFCVDNPKLWWTYDISGKKPDLYRVEIKLLDGKKIIDKAEKSIGIRTLTLNREKDEFGSNFQFVLNGVPIFIKGANYIPPDSFITRFTADKLNYMLDAVQFSNMNMIRIWGGGYYGSDELYNECDRRGILLWQDFMFACQPYPFFDEALLDNVKNEIVYNVKRLRNHPSLALWCGNNEIEAMSAAWITRKDYVDWTEKFFYHILEPEIRKLDTSTPFIPGSPTGTTHNKNIDSDSVGDTHLWAVWHGLQPMNYYRRRMTRFCSEFGFESLPDIKTIRTFASPSDYSLKSEVFNAHQKCMSGNDKMIYYIASRFHLPEQFEDFIYLSQVAQQECISDATEHWRRNKGRCNGSMYWQLNDCWPVCSWAGMDYYGNYKALQYTSRRFNAPVSVSIEDNKDKTRIVLLNDTLENKTLTVNYSLFDFTKGVVSSGKVSVLIGKNSVKEIFVFDMKKLSQKFNLKNTGLLAEAELDGEIISRKTVLFGKEKNLNLPKANIQKSAEIKDGKLFVTVKSDVFARIVRIESDISILPFTDNFFDLLPNEEKTVSMSLDSSVSPEEQKNSISVFCCTDVESKNDTLNEKITMAKIFCQPGNFANFIWYGKPSN